ncbi:pre-rRNA-processing protein PNO1 [Syncephalis pseudoplumigaleata]|uniref:Pre-rRNA-processing protein PNO1 n=1 Tax=Syncephalis pseudoplumigaleata TaxID=1712513 RepID=A0A4P9Z1T2_9FUNG|nr:pre-rRNA-processing protein PNO1 [Syncephalis pseudoplumigaleata]|eukprot:RKP26404.1 pre-rRNA-processing protein PNO1 [Syncephalis pseudoplumigaleata]
MATHGAEVMIDPEALQVTQAALEDTSMAVDEPEKPAFKPLKTNSSQASGECRAASGAACKGKSESRKVPIPPHRLSPLRREWLKIYSPLVEHMKLQIRMNIRSKTVELRTCPQTTDASALQRGADFVKAYALGFQIEDAIALLRLDDLYIDTFEIKDVKTLHGDNLARAIGRIAGKDGKTRFTIENASKTRIVLADTKIHILGSFQNIKIARDAVVSLILGSPPGKVYNTLRTISSRMKERF